MPDLNSVPPSPRPISSSPRITATSASRRASQQMSPPPVPLATATNILPSNQSAVNAATAHSSPPAATTAFPSYPPPPGDNTGVGAGPGPLRHPRPLTAADLHLQLEKEQEAVVNRLTRELSMLRAAQNASVVSNASSTSAGLPDSADHSSNHLLSGPSHPAPSQRRHHRSSSSTSVRSVTGGPVLSGSTAGWNTAGIAGSLASVYTPSTSERTRGNLPRHDSIPQPLSRQNSITSSRRSGASSPAPGALSSSYQHPESFPQSYPMRPSLSQREASSGSYIPTLPLATDPLTMASVTSVPTTGRYEEAAFHRHELEAVRRENEGLRRRIRELERTLRDRRASDASRTDASRTRSESVSTTASMSVRGREREKEADDGVRVGESARGGGLS